MGSVIDELNSFGIGRRHPNDSFFAAGDKICKKTERLGVFDIDDEELCHQSIAAFPCHVPGCNVVFESLMLFEMHYNSLHRYPCSVCKKQLPSAHLLNLHVSESHDSFFQAQAERMPMYSCFVEECGLKFTTPTERRDHCISVHKFPHDFRFDNHKRKGKNKKPKKSNLDELTDIDMKEPGAHNASKRPAKSVVLGKEKRGGKMWHSQKLPNASTTVGIEFETIAQELRESLPREEMS